MTKEAISNGIYTKDEAEPEENGGHYYLTKAFFFTDEQVEKRTAED